MVAVVEIVIEDDRWSALELDALAMQAARATFRSLGLPDEGFSICVMACDDARIVGLNADFRGKPQPTNVLSWPSDERGAEVPGTAPDVPVLDEFEDGHLGDIAIAYDTCAAEALAGGKPMADHVTHLLVHGILHLLGYDHVRDADGDLMEALEARILAQLGLRDPYSA